VLFAAFVFSYLTLDSTFMAMISFSEPFGKYLSPASGAFVVFLEGAATGSIVAIPVLRTFRKREREELAGETIQLLNRL
jgi:hypothetical protein